MKRQTLIAADDGTAALISDATGAGTPAALGQKRYIAAAPVPTGI